MADPQLKIESVTESGNGKSLGKERRDKIIQVKPKAEEKSSFFATLSAQSRSALDKLYLQQQNDLCEMRWLWSRILGYMLVLIVLSDVGLKWAIGFDIVHFGKNDLPVLAGESLLQTIGLAGIIVAFLFSKGSLHRNGGE